MTMNCRRSTTRIRKNDRVARKSAIDQVDQIRRKSLGEKKTIVVPFDFTRASEHALDHAISHARNSESEVRIVHVLEPFYGHGFLDKYQKEEWQVREKERALDRLEGVVASKKCKGIPITIEVRIGLPEHEILKASEAANTGLIVMGRKTRGVLSRWVFGSVTENVLEGTRYPVLVLTSPTDELGK